MDIDKTRDERLQEILDFISVQGSKILNHFNGKNLDRYQLYIIGLYERMVKGVKSISLLHRDVENYTTHEFSIGLIIRTLCLDSLIVYNLISILRGLDQSETNRKKHYEEMINLANRGFSEGLKYAATTAKKAHDAGLFESTEYYLTYIDSFVNAHKDFFEEYLSRGTVPKTKFKPFEGSWALTENLLNTDFQMLTGLYFSYDVFSKYEHYGILYFDVRNGKTDEKRNQILRTVEKLLYTNAMLGVLISLNNSDITILNQNTTNTNYLHKYMDKYYPV